MVDLSTKLQQVLEKEKEREEQRAAAATEETADAEDALFQDQTRNLRRAEEKVLYILELFETYVRDSVLTEQPGLFSLSRVPYGQATRMGDVLGTLKPSAEHQIARVTFKETSHLYLRISAVILSRELEVVAIFARDGKDAPPPESRPVDLTRWAQRRRVDWKGAFESIFVEFLEWYDSGAGG